MSRAWIRAVAGALAFGASAASAEVYVVGPAQPGVDFTSLGTAIALASDGDTLLLLPAASAYGPVQISGKSLDLVARDGKPVIASLVVRDLASAQRVRVAGIRVIGFDSSAPMLHLPPMRSIANAGLLEMQDCAIDFQPSPFAADAMSVEDSSHVVLVRCTLKGNDAVAGLPGTGGDALQAVGSSVWLYGCQLAGGTASGSPDLVPVPAGAAVRAIDSSVHALACAGTGGEGALSIFAVFGPPSALVFRYAPGAPAIALDGSVLELQDCLWKAGRNLASDTQPVTPNVTIAGASAVTSLTGHPLLVDVAAIQVEGGSVHARITGEPGTRTVLLAGPAAIPASLPGVAGELLVAAPMLVVPLGSMPANGTLAVDGMLRSMPAGVEAASFTLQTAGIATTGAAWSNPRLLVVLDAAF